MRSLWHDGVSRGEQGARSKTPQGIRGETGLEGSGLQQLPWVVESDKMRQSLKVLKRLWNNQEESMRGKQEASPDPGTFSPKGSALNSPQLTLTTNSFVYITG